MRVAILSVSEDRAKIAAEKTDKTGTNVIGFKCDVTDAESIEATIDGNEVKTYKSNSGSVKTRKVIEYKLTDIGIIIKTEPFNIMILYQNLARVEFDKEDVTLEIITK
jgi:NAD(P)-dependent dehydrogenase (short-subunit alcohol dehydrogenase family)